VEGTRVHRNGHGDSEVAANCLCRSQESAVTKKRHLLRELRKNPYRGGGCRGETYPPREPRGISRGGRKKKGGSARGGSRREGVEYVTDGTVGRIPRQKKGYLLSLQGKEKFGNGRLHSARNRRPGLKGEEERKSAGWNDRERVRDLYHEGGKEIYFVKKRGISPALTRGGRTEKLQPKREKEIGLGRLRSAVQRRAKKHCFPIQGRSAQAGEAGKRNRNTTMDLKIRVRAKPLGGGSPAEKSKKDLFGPAGRRSGPPP